MSGTPRICNRCMVWQRGLTCESCGRPTKNRRYWTEWNILCYLAELKDDQYQTAGELFRLCGDHISRPEFTHFLNGLERRGLVIVKHASDEPRYYREPEALMEFHLGRMA